MHARNTCGMRRARYKGPNDPNAGLVLLLSAIMLRVSSGFCVLSFALVVGCGSGADQASTSTTSAAVATSGAGGSGAGGAGAGGAGLMTTEVDVPAGDVTLHVTVVGGH